MYSTVLATEPPLLSHDLRADLEQAGLTVVAESTNLAELARAAVEHAPDFVVAASNSPSTVMLEAARVLGSIAPCPFIVFTSDADAEKIQLAAGAGVHAYVIDGYSKHRVLSVIQVARARFRHEQVLKEELSGLSKRFEERKVVDRAKGLLMRSRQASEDEAFEILRTLAMRTRQRIGTVAQHVIDVSRAGEAVNRSGQLRMLSQRVVKSCAQMLCGVEKEHAAAVLSDAIQRIELNFAIVSKAIASRGYDQLLDRANAAWHSLKTALDAPLSAAALDSIDALAEQMLRDAENLTEFLESSGLVPNLRVLNISGRQRMLSQRIGKLCFLLTIRSDSARLAQLAALTQEFEAALGFLEDAPLSSKEIRAELEKARNDWERLYRILADTSSSDEIIEVSDATERLLHLSERLTDHYERAMQVLIGDGLNGLGRFVKPNKTSTNQA